MSNHYNMHWEFKINYHNEHALKYVPRYIYLQTIIGIFITELKINGIKWVPAINSSRKYTMW